MYFGDQTRGYREKTLFRSLTKLKEIIMKVLAEKEGRDVKEEDKKEGSDIKEKDEKDEKERHNSTDSEPALTIDDSVNNDECEITDTKIASELRILELAEQLEERLFVAFLHSKVRACLNVQLMSLLNILFHYLMSCLGN